MLDEEMDHIIRDAAENHHPPYNDKAWEKMEQMLDKHLPQKKDNRKYIFFLLLFLLLGGGALYSIYQFSQGDDQPAVAAAADKSGSKAPALAANPATGGNGQPASSTDPEKAGSTTGTASGTTATGTTTAAQPVTVTGSASPAVNLPSAATSSSPGINTGGKETDLSKKTNRTGKGRSSMRISNPVPATDNEAQDQAAIAVNDARRKTKKNTGKKNIAITPASPSETEPAPSAEPIQEKSKPAEVQPEKEIITKNEPVQSEDKKAEAPAVKEEKQDEKKPEKPLAANKPAKSADKQKRGFRNNFGITVSAGPDVSFISLNKLGKATLLYGAGISYTFAKQKLTVRTGFYTSKKIYDAAPDQYHSPGGNYPNLYNVAADCRIYEIPIGLSYHFGTKGKHDWFGAAGISSYLMKTESYDYQYKTSSGYTYNYLHKVKNENNHYFSVITLSAGYQYKLSKRISLQAEPYVKIPLGGVGVGKVKLNSGGILFTATIRPFAKKD